MCCVLIILSLQADNHEALWSDCCGVCVYEMMMMVVVVSHLVNTTHDNLQLTGCQWLTAPHTILLLSSPTSLQTMLECWSYHQASSDTITPAITDDRPPLIFQDFTFNLLECGQNLWARRLVILYNGPVAVLDPGNSQLPIIPVISSTTTQPVSSPETNAQQWHFWHESLL